MTHITIRETEDPDPKFIYFIDGVLYSQPGFGTENEAQKAAEDKLKDMNRKDPRGGPGRGGGRKKKEPTVVVRVPVSKLEQVQQIIKPS